MKKEKVIKYGIISLLGILLISPLKASAAPNATAEFWHEEPIGDLYVADGDSGEKEQYYNPHFTVTANGETFPAYCIDPGLHLSSGASLTCSDDYLNNGQRGAFEWLINESGLAGNQWELQLGLRHLARKMKLTTSGINSEPWSDSPSMNVNLFRINQIAEGGLGRTSTFKPYKTGSTNSTNGTITLGEASGSGQNYTIPLTTTLDPNSLKVSCTGCETSAINGKTITVTLKKDICSFTLTVSYNGKEAQSSTPARYSQKRPVLCKPTSSSIQTMFIYTDIVFQDNLSATKKYNVGGENCTEPEQPDKCNEKTQVEIPQYCDISGNEIKITAPKNAKYCILNSNDDAGNTYQDTSTVKTDNPYCAVYCKEDYVMSLPGAKYSDSGRYFELENTVVNATRTCYATNADNDPEKGVNINKYLSDIKKAQEDLRDAYNAYIKAKHEAELAKSAMPQHGTDCNNNQSGTYKEINSQSYNDGITLTNYNRDTGEYQVRAASIQTDHHIWGSEGRTTTSGTKCVDQLYDYGSYDPEGNLNTARSNLNAAENHLKEVINNMEDCYNWTNNLCLNPEVVFDYNEQYSGDINYELVSGGGTIVGKDATYKTGSKDGNTSIDNEYTTSGNSTLENPAYVNCTENGCTAQKTEKGISTNSKALYYRKIEVTGTAEYANTQEFQTNYPHGTIDTIPEGAEVHKNYSYLGAVFPVALNTSTGVYKWTLNFSNLGMYNDEDSCKNGRLDEVVKAVNGESVSAGIEYVCVYVVDCDDCDYECVGDYCYYEEEPKCPECDVYCENCIFDGNITFNYEQISLNDMNPNNRTMGSNWTSEKGQKVLTSIEDAAETAYEQPQYVITLTPSNMKEIRDYNKETDTYVAQDLDYHTQDEIPNAYGTSSFLRDEKNQRKFFKEIKLNNDWELWTSVDKANHVGPAYK